MIFAILPFISSLRALSADPTAEELLAQYDRIMGPKSFQSEMVMTAYREDGTNRTYEMKAIKSEDDKFRIWFLKPSAVLGQEMLRVGDNGWLYIPNLKRATRISNRDNFQGGDFNNADVLRVNYTLDYVGKIIPNTDTKLFQIELKAKSKESSYDMIQLWMRKEDFMPVKGEYYGASGKKLRSAEFSEYKEFDKSYKRPAKVIMKNEIIPARRSEMTTVSMKINIDFPPQKFTQTDLGK